MGHAENAGTARQLLECITEGADPEKVAGFFGDDVQFEIPGDVDALPWIGLRFGRKAAADFVRDSRRLIERPRFHIDEILASGERAVVVGEVTTRILATGKTFESAFAIVLTFRGAEIARFQMLEDSFAVSEAAR